MANFIKCYIIVNDTYTGQLYKVFCHKNVPSTKLKFSPSLRVTAIIVFRGDDLNSTRCDNIVRNVIRVMTFTLIYGVM